MTANEIPVDLKKQLLWHEKREEELLEYIEKQKTIIKELRFCLIQERVANVCNGIDATDMIKNLCKDIKL